MKSVYLALAILGAVVPYVFFGQFFAQGGGLVDFVAALFANPAAGGFTADLLISSLVFWLLMFTRRGKGGPPAWPFILINLTIGLSCALPGYLWWSSREGGSNAS